MKIKEMTATFGNLNKASLRPGEGFTLISAPNESGKSTWAAFLRAMLYGFPARDRSKEGYIAEKTRYQPWSGAPMEGTMTVEWQGRDITLYRGPKGTTAWGTFTAVYTATGEPVPGLTAENCGEALLGVSREVFERTAFVGQGEIALSPSGDLEKRVAALATSGEEEVSFSQVERRLKDWLNRRKVNSKVGLIPQLEGELSLVKENLDRQGSLLRRAQEAQREKETLEQRQAELEAKLRSHAAARSAQQAEKRAQAQRDYEAAQAELDAAQAAVRAIPDAETLQNAQGDMRYLTTLEAQLKLAERDLPEAREKAGSAERAVQEDPFFPGMDPAQAAAQAQRDSEQAAQLTKKAPFFLWCLAGFCVGVLLCVLIQPGFLFDWTFPLWETLNRMDPMGGGLDWLMMALPFGLVGTLIACFALLFQQRGRKRKAAVWLAKYNAQTPEDILTRATEYAQKANAAQEAQRALQTLETERDKLAAQKEELTAQLFELVRPFAPDAATLVTVSAAITRALQQGERYKLAQAKAEAARKLLTALPTPEAAGAVPITMAAPEGDPTALAAQLAAVNGELERASTEWARLQGELHSLGDPAEWEAKRSALLEDLDRRRGEFDAIAAALDGLKEADSLLRERFSPAVNERSGHYLALLTGGKYDRAALTRQFQALAQESGEAVSRQDLTLSGGTAQQLYLAVRLAMCELALPQDDPCPILLDDVLDAFDDGRAGLALDCLLDIAKKRQVLLFTCHNREKAMLAGRDVRLLEV